MRQLQLFEEGVLSTAPSDLPASPGEGASAADAGVGQLDLFGRRSLAVGRVGEAIAAGRLDEARRLLAEMRAGAPGDVALRRHAAQVTALYRRVRRADALPPPARAPALLEVARALHGAPGAWGALRAVLLRRVAEDLRADQGDDGELEGQPPGYYLLEAGAAAEAQASLAAAASLRRLPRTLFLLADAGALLGEPASRRIYLEALLLDPFDPALATARDVAVRELPDVARHDLEIEDDPTAWAAPVGLVLGVLPRAPAPGAPPLTPADLPDPPRSPEQLAALARARTFFEAFALASSRDLRHDNDAVIAARRTMKRLAPTLFEAYLGRRAST
jgi:hypothetical protein